MTTPSVPPRRPGSTTPPDNDVMDYVRRLEARVAELERKDMTNSTVGQGGTFRGVYDNGVTMFTFGKDKDDGVRKLRMNFASTGEAAFQVGPGNPALNEAEQFKLVDQNGKKVFATDGIAGYGLAEPSFQHLLVPIYGLNWVAGVAQVAAAAFTFFYNPVVYSQIQVRNYSGVTAMAGKLRVTNGDGDFVESSQTAAQAANSTMRRIVLIPKEFINAQNCKAEWIMTPTGSGTADVWPRMCRGVSKSFYDINANDQ